MAKRKTNLPKVAESMTPERIRAAVERTLSEGTEEFRAGFRDAERKIAASGSLKRAFKRLGQTRGNA